jgi:Fe-S-cluster-containing dehydrogenase component/DMSO reductase anchor subunit
MTAAPPFPGAADLVLPGVVAETSPPKRRLPVLPVAALLEEQRTLTAVERFAKRHDEEDLAARSRQYRDLLPLERPQPGEQYAFEVDLDACTGCKACVSACHTLNGLDDAELWRTVGLLHGGTASAPAVQTITTSCHHCLEPACLLGCPTLAYEKDPVTGIVKHLDDQCFGCEYCTMTCPYDAPKYNRSKGIVRKCDMCSERLAHGEAPACVQACPNGAIAIRVVTHAEVVEAADARSFLPGVAAPDQTLPTTVYKTQKAVPGNMLPADFYRTSAEQGHPPLVVMLTLTQLSAGAFATEWCIERVSGRAGTSTLALAAFAAALAVLALGASVLHLGRPWLAWRAVLGWRTSWLSREAIAFGVYAPLALAHAVLTGVPAPLAGWLGKETMLSVAPALESATALAGVLGIFCSVMVYVVTRRAQWSVAQTGVKFFGTALVLGAASTLAFHASADAPDAFHRLAPVPCVLVLVVTALKLALDAAVLRHRRDPRHSVLKRMAVVMLGDLRAATTLRLACAFAGGCLAPLVLAVVGYGGPFVVPGTALMLLLLLVAELAERYLFFRAAPPSRMPGGLR